MLLKIAVSNFPPFLQVLKKLPAEFIALSPEFEPVLRGVELSAQSLASYGNGLKDKACTYAVEILFDTPNYQVDNGLGPRPAEFINKHLAPFLYPRLADLAIVVLALDEAKPDLVLLQDDIMPLHRQTALWAKARGVPCLHVPHAIYQMVNRGALGTDVHDLLTASHIAVSGPYQRQWYEKLGAQNIKETGLPQHDRWAELKPNRILARQKLGLDIKQPVVTYASTWPQTTNILGAHDEWAFVYLDFLKAIKKLPGVQTVVKMHPSGGQESMRWHLQEAQKLNVEILGTAMYNEFVLQASDLIIAFGGSNILLEAAHVPWCRLATVHGYDDDPEVGQFKPSQFEKSIKDALKQAPPDTAKFRQKYLGKDDGQASQRVADWIIELCS